MWSWSNVSRYKHNRNIIEDARQPGEVQKMLPVLLRNLKISQVLVKKNTLLQ